MKANWDKVYVKSIMRGLREEVGLPMVIDILRDKPPLRLQGSQ